MTDRARLFDVVTLAAAGNTDADVLQKLAEQALAPDDTGFDRNAARRSRAIAALDRHGKLINPQGFREDSWQIRLTDLLTDVRHLVASDPGCFEEAVRLSEMHFKAELS
jgi:aspartokinase